MNACEADWFAHQRQRLLRHDWQSWVRPDAGRWMPPDAKHSLWPQPARQRPCPEYPDISGDAARRAALAAKRELLLRHRSELAALKAELKFWQFLRTLKYNADQPRVPAGNPDGGQWTRVAGLAPIAGIISGADFSPDQSGWHDYIAGPNLMCRADLQCSPAEIADQLARFSVPGRDPSNPVKDGEFSLVEDPRSGLPGGWVWTAIEDNGLTVVNSTSPAHAFYNGEVIRSARQEDDGSWKVTTHGFGNNVVPGANIINQEQGPPIFNLLDQRMRENIERHHAKGAFHLAMLRLDGCGHSRPRVGMAGSDDVR